MISFFGKKRPNPASATSKEGDFAESGSGKAMAAPSLLSEHSVRDTWARGSYMLDLLPNPDPILQSEGIQLSTYRRMVDGHLGAVKRKRRAAVRARPWRLVSTDVSPKSFAVVSQVFNLLDVRETMSHIWEANLLGYSVLEIMWRQQGNLILPYDLLDKPQEWFGWGRDRQMRYKDETGLTEIVPPRKYLAPRAEPTYSNPYGYPLLSECFWPLAFKRGGLQFWVTFVERYGMPRAIGKVPPNASDPERHALLGSLASMVRDAVMVINSNQSVDLQEATGKASSTAAYSELIKWADTEISKAILGETLTTELPTTGSLAAAQVHNDVRKDLAMDDATLIEKTFNQLIRWIYEINFPAELTLPRFEVVLPEDLNQARVARDRQLTAMGIRFTTEYYRDIYDIDPRYIASIEAPAGSGSAAAAGGEFAEHAAGCCHGPEFVEGEIKDILSSVTPQDMQDQMEELLRPILELAAKHSDYAEFDKALETLFPELPFDKFQETMEKCLLLSEMRGKVRNG